LKLALTYLRNILTSYKLTNITLLSGRGEEVMPKVDNWGGCEIYIIFVDDL